MKFATAGHWCPFCGTETLHWMYADGDRQCSNVHKGDGAPHCNCSLCSDRIEWHHLTDEGGNNHLSCRREVDDEISSARKFLALHEK